MGTVMMGYPNKTSFEVHPYTLRDLLVALELGPADDTVLEYLYFLSKKVPVKAATFMHVIPNFRWYGSYTENDEDVLDPYTLNTTILEDMRQRIKQHPISVQAKFSSFEVEHGDPLEAVLKAAEDILPELLVIGQKSGKGEHGILARNLARKVASNALIIPQGAQASLSKIIVPIDFSNDSIKALKTAISIQDQLEGAVEIHAVHVYQMPNLSIYKVQRTQKALKQMVEEDRIEAFRRFLNSYFPGYKRAINFDLIEQEGPGIARYILQFAKKNKADMIVMGAKGHSKVERLLLGSVTEKLCTLNKRIPTMIVRI